MRRAVRRGQPAKQSKQTLKQTDKQTNFLPSRQHEAERRRNRGMEDSGWDWLRVTIRSDSVVATLAGSLDAFIETIHKSALLVT